MNNENSSGSATSPQPVPRSRTLHRLLAVLPAVTFVLGAVLGGVVVGVAGGDSGGDGSGRSTEATPSETSTPSPGDTAVIVPQECIAVADTVSQLTQVVRDNIDAIRQFRSQPIVDMLNRLEELDQQARDQAQACRKVQVQSVSTSPDESPTVPTSASPS